MKYNLEMLLTSFGMVKKNLKSYIMLSITIILSFSLLLGYLIYSDSSLYNEYKVDLGTTPNVFVIDASNEVLQNPLAKMNLLEQKINKDDDTVCYRFTEQGNEFRGISYRIFLLPQNAFAFFQNFRTRYIFNNSNRAKVSKNCAVISEELYQYMKSEVDSKGDLYINIPITMKNGKTKLYSLLVSDTYSMNNNEKNLYYNRDSNQLEGYSAVFVSDTTFQDNEVYTENTSMVIYSKRPKIVQGWLNNLDLAADASSYEIVDQIYSKIVDLIDIKILFAIIIMILLGINMYGSFTNALEKRKFEIGVRRAIGASKKDIVLQFFYEGIIIIGVNIIISIMIVIFVFSMYKIIIFYRYGVEWIISTNVYSIIIFLLCGVFLTLYYSLLFGIKSTNVEVVQYLKAE